MVIVSERYEADDWDPLCDGWEIGVGRDTRLDRPVVLARFMGPDAESAEVNAWLQRRALLSDGGVAQLLDLERRSGEFICVFEGQADSRVGLPNVAMPELLRLCLAVVEGAQALHAAGATVSFFGGQVLYESGQARVLGLYMRRPIPTLTELTGQLAQYFGSVLEWNVLSGENPERVPDFLHTGIRRLLGQLEHPLLDLDELRVFLETLSVDDLPESSAGATEGLADGVDPRANEVFDDVGQTYEPETASWHADIESPDDEADGEDFEYYEDMPASTKRRLVPWTVGLGLLAVAVLVVGFLIVRGVSGTVSDATAPPGQSEGGGTKAADSSSPAGSQSVVGTGTGTGRSAPSSSGTTGKPGAVVTLPRSLDGEPASQAVHQLRQLGIAAADVQAVAIAGSVDAGDVSAVSPPVGSAWRSGQVIRLDVVVPSGDELVPDLLGVSEATASQMLLENMFHYSYAVDAHAGVAAGLVFAQDPSAFALAAKQSTVTFRVAGHY